MERWVIKVDQNKYLSDISEGLLLTTERIGGHSTYNNKGATNQAMLFPSEHAAFNYIADYLQTPLPPGKKHSTLTPFRIK